MDTHNRAVIIAQEIANLYDEFSIGQDISAMRQTIEAQLAAAEREAWNAAIEAALDVCERMRERFVILEQDERTSYEERHDNGTSAGSLMQATNAIKSLLK